VVTLSRKLGEALDHSGDHAGADGVLREAMDFVGPASRERARMLLELGRVSIHRERQRDAMRLLGQAIEIGTSTRDGRCAAEARLELGLLRSAAGDFATASTTLESALDVLENEQNADGLLARASLALADIALERRDPDSAGRHLFVALARARAMGSGAILARVSSARARLESLRGNTAGAGTLKADAMALAGEAGDALFLRTLQSQ
jgi:tetratricopeptide (TPR) repeat protein